MRRGIYVSNDELERAFALRFGYRELAAHAREIGVPDPDETLVIDFDHVLFDAKDAAVVKASEAARRGVVIGIHTYYPGDPRLQPFLALPNVVVAKTHLGVLSAIGRLVQARERRPAALVVSGHQAR